MSVWFRGNSGLRTCSWWGRSLSNLPPWLSRHHWCRPLILHKVHPTLMWTCFLFYKFWWWAFVMPRQDLQFGKTLGGTSCWTPWIAVLSSIPSVVELRASFHRVFPTLEVTNLHFLLQLSLFVYPSLVWGFDFRVAGQLPHHMWENEPTCRSICPKCFAYSFMPVSLGLANHIF